MDSSFQRKTLRQQHNYSVVVRSLTRRDPLLMSVTYLDLHFGKKYIIGEKVRQSQIKKLLHKEY